MFQPADGRVSEIQDAFQHAYDPRVTWLEDRWYVTWCNGYHGPTIGIGYTHDFRRSPSSTTRSCRSTATGSCSPAGSTTAT